MPLTITRRPGETFELTWPSGERRTMKVVQIQGDSAWLSDGDHSYAITRVRQAIIRVPGSSETVGINVAGCNRGHPGQIALYIDAPRSIHILRDNAVRRTPREEQV